MFNFQPTPKPTIFISADDKKILQQLAFTAFALPDVADELLNELDRAQIADAAQARSYIGLGSKATYKTSAGDEKTIALVVPGEADIARGKVSILTPMGVALLGLSAGQSIDWTARDGRVGTLTVLQVF